MELLFRPEHLPYEETTVNRLFQPRTLGSQMALTPWKLRD